MAFWTDFWEWILISVFKALRFFKSFYAQTFVFHFFQKNVNLEIFKLEKNFNNKIFFIKLEKIDHFSLAAVFDKIVSIFISGREFFWVFLVNKKAKIFSKEKKFSKNCSMRKYQFCNFEKIVLLIVIKFKKVRIPSKIYRSLWWRTLLSITDVVFWNSFERDYRRMLNFLLPQGL